MKLKSVFTALFLCAVSFQAVAQDFTEQDPTKHQPRVFPMPVKHLTMHSNVLNCDKNFSVILPKSYDKEPDRKYPVLYLLHGHGENDWEWANIPVSMINERISQVTNDGSAAEMIIVQPNATEYQSGYFNHEGWMYEDYFFTELVPLIERNFRVIPDKGHRAIAGLSMGGGGSFYYGCSHPEMFSSVYAISAAVGSFATGRGTVPGPAGNAKAGQAINEKNAGPQFQNYGKNAKKEPAAKPAAQPQNNTFTSGVDLENLDPAKAEAMKTIAWTLDCGDDDFLFAGNAQTYQQMKALGMNIQFRTREGVHASYYWYEALGLAMQFATRHFSEQCK